MIPVVRASEGPAERPPEPPSPQALAAAVWAAYRGDRDAARDALTDAAGILDDDAEVPDGG